MQRTIQKRHHWLKKPNEEPETTGPSKGELTRFLGAFLIIARQTQLKSPGIKCPGLEQMDMQPMPKSLMGIVRKMRKEMKLQLISLYVALVLAVMQKKSLKVQKARKRLKSYNMSVGNRNLTFSEGWYCTGITNLVLPRSANKRRFNAYKTYWSGLLAKFKRVKYAKDGFITSTWMYWPWQSGWRYSSRSFNNWLCM